MKNKSFYFTLLLFFIAMDTSAARCLNVSIKYNFPAQIDITQNKKWEISFYSFGAPDAPINVAGQCLHVLANSGAGNTNGNYIYIVDQYGSSPTLCPTTGTVDKNSPDGYLRFSFSRKLC